MILIIDETASKVLPLIIWPVNNSVHMFSSKSKRAEQNSEPANCLFFDETVRRKHQQQACPQPIFILSSWRRYACIAIISNYIKINVKCQRQDLCNGHYGFLRHYYGFLASAITDAYTVNIIRILYLDAATS